MMKEKFEFPIQISKLMVDKFCKKKSLNPAIEAMYL